jgi:hypothetical protein
MCELTHCLCWRNWRVWNSSISSLIHHWRCRKQPPVEGVLYWSFSLLLVFQPRSVYSAYSNVSVLKLMGESFTAYETTTFPLAFPTDRSPNKSLQRAMPCRSSVSNHVFFQTHILCCWNWNWAHSGGNFSEGSCTQEQKLSLVDDWRHCCRCSWLKRRGAASIGRGQAVIPQKTVQTFTFPFDAQLLFRQIWV